jgi:hypothetical protein
MPALVAGIHVLLSVDERKRDVDGRDEPGHDDAANQCRKSHCYSVSIMTRPFSTTVL